MLLTPFQNFSPPPPTGLDESTLAQAQAIITDVRTQGDAALRHHGQRLGDLQPNQPLLLTKDDLARAAAAINPDHLALLHRTADRIRTFAQAQRNCLTDLRLPVPGGTAGHTIAPVHAAGCYAPGGRFPLPSSVLMTAVTARVAGVQRVIVASPRPAPITLAAAHVANADALLTVGGAHAIAALAFGTPSLPRVDTIVGPGNRYVTAAKKLVLGHVGIDMLAGPSELLIIADDTAHPPILAADLLAQAEHDTDAAPYLVTTSPSLAHAVERELQTQLQALPEPSRTTAHAALRNGRIILCDSLDQAIAASDALAPEHLELHVANPQALAQRLAHFGGLFIGPHSAEVFGDYGLGPNHVLPTGQTARFSAGLSVFHFLRIRTFLHLTSTPANIIQDTATLAQLEGLQAHARSAQSRTASI